MIHPYRTAVSIVLHVPPPPDILSATLACIDNNIEITINKIDFEPK
jgi:hypothetical protein